MFRRTALALPAAVLAAASIASAAGATAFVVHGLSAEAPVPFSAPQNAGMDALRVVHPAEAKAGGEKLSLTAVAFPKDSGMRDTELLDYVKTAFLATSAAGKPVERTFLGKKVTGQALEKKVPAPSLAQVFVVTKKGGDKVVLAFVFTPGFAKEAGEAIAAIAVSLKE